MDTCAYLLERYPQVFVEAVITDAHCDRDSHGESFPLLDVVGSQITTAATIYATMQAFENMLAINAWATEEQARRRWDEARALIKVAAAKEGERAQEARAGRRERLRDQPWRKGRHGRTT